MIEKRALTNVRFVAKCVLSNFAQKNAKQPTIMTNLSKKQKALLCGLLCQELATIKRENNDWIYNKEKTIQKIFKKLKL